MVGPHEKKILEALRDSEGSLRGSELSRATGVPVRGIYVQLNRLKQKGYVRADNAITRNFHVNHRGFKITETGLRILHTIDWLEEQEEASR